MSVYVIAYDIGTTGVKTCLFSISAEEKIKLIAGELQDYDLCVLDDGGAEQDPMQWWDAMGETTKKLLARTGITKEQIGGISFCAQMQALVLVDQQGNPVRNAMSYMDSRGIEEMEETLGKGFKIAGINARKLVRSIQISKAVSASAKDPVWKYRWVKTHEPEVFARAYKWLDVKDFLVCRATGKFVMSRDSAFATLLYDTRKGREGFSRELCAMMEVDPSHLPEICDSAHMVSGMTSEAAETLGLLEGTPVFSGGGDAALIGVGAGAVDPGDTHVYIGTSGWVSTVVKKQKLDIRAMMASIVGTDPGSFIFFAELETAGKCLEWARDHIGLDDMEIFSEKKPAYQDPESRLKNIYDYIMKQIGDIPAGSNGVMFTPWLHGNRCPFEDPNARGMFFNIGIENGAKDLFHAVIEGVCFHLKWQLTAMEKHTKTSNPIRFVGGGALSPLTCQILANVLDRQIETVENPQNVGAVGAAAIMALGLKLVESVEQIKGVIPVSQKYEPDPKSASLYQELFPVFQQLYKNNKKAFQTVNKRRK